MPLPAVLVVTFNKMVNALTLILVVRLAVLAVMLYNPEAVIAWLMPLPAVLVVTFNKMVNALTLILVVFPVALQDMHSYLVLATK
jgi:hypothetical protein